MASPTQKGSPPPPPLIGRAGNLTIFITPPIPKATAAISSNSDPSPVQAPPIRWQPDPPLPRTSLDSVFHFLWTALAKAQHVHSSLDCYMADWFGLDHSKYQRELNAYYETNTKASED